MVCMWFSTEGDNILQDSHYKYMHKYLLKNSEQLTSQHAAVQETMQGYFEEGRRIATDSNLLPDRLDF